MRELDKVIGYENIKTELYRIIDIIQNPSKYKALGVKIPQGVLFHGVPGIGKTLMAQSFIKECGRKSFVIRKDRPDGEFVDYIRETFKQAAEAEPSILLLDDIDKFANEDHMHRDAEEYVTVQACIDSYKDKDVFIVATCNDYRAMPPSLVRRGRFDKTFGMSYPKPEDAKKIIAFYLKDKAVAVDLDIDEIVRFCDRRSCADLETVINEAGVLAGYENKDLISQDDLRRACLSIFWSIKKRPEDEQCPFESIRRRAVHEAGHATLIEYFTPGDVSFVTIERPRDAMVLRKHDDHRFEDFKNHEIEIMISLAGKAATEVVLGVIDMGTESDLREAYDATSALLDDVASYDFQSWCHGDETSQRVFDHLDDVKGAEMARYYFNTKQILMQNRAFLDALIEQIIEKKTLTYKDIAPIREKHLNAQTKAA